VSVYLRGSDLTGQSHQRKFGCATDDTYRIFTIASQLMEEIWTGKTLRGMGVRVSELVTNDFMQLSFFEPINEKKRSLDKAIDQLRLRFGAASVVRSCFVGSGLAPITGGVIEDFKMMSSLL